jgi:cytochrome P450
MVESIFKERKQTMQDSSIDNPSDFLSALLADKSVQNPQFVRDMLVTVIFGGRDNMQNSLAWSLQELHKSPKWLAKMRGEALNNHRNGNILDYQDLSVSMRRFS